MEYLVISVLGGNQAGIANRLTEIAAASKCNVVDSKMLTFGEEFVANFLLSGNWSTLVRLEAALEGIEKKENLQIIKQRTRVVSYPKDMLPYIVYIVAKDQQGILHDVTEFFTDLQITITELHAETRPARKSGTLVMSLTMYINVPSDTNLADLREKFLIFCDSYNLDGVMEAEKGL